MDISDSNQETYTAAYLKFHKAWDSKMKALVNHLNSSRTSDECSAVINETEELDAKLREFPFNLVEEQSAALWNLGDVFDEARFKFTHQEKQELAEQSKLLQEKINAWGLPPKPIDPFKVIVNKKGRKSSDSDEESSAKKQRTDVTATQNRFAQLSVEYMDLSAQADTSTANETPAYAYHRIRKYVNENNLESYTYILPEDKKLCLVIRGLPTDMPPMDIIGSLAAKNIKVNECHIMTSKRTGKAMPLFLITLDKTEQNRAVHHVTDIGYMKVKVESLRPKYGPPQCFRYQGFFHSSKFCTRTPRCVKCAGEHLVKDCARNQNAVFVKVNILPASWVAPETQETWLKKKTPIPKHQLNPPRSIIPLLLHPKVNFWEIFEPKEPPTPTP
ncbi:nucleic-acid-binding protein from transposon X-element [Trichonephila inaurata madagascariensis]|uniref:Nucleic-acid-binding protein from transposon X-element n=1 Tax=Trichonephila inaurata madagascariensis TaxID=2747483 RepID=A0A8X7CNR8_9ARAC|nr:nucleic-acid-binding protein from transposon X-element [Trichonephila inaurata madagascariensis]